MYTLFCFCISLNLFLNSVLKVLIGDDTNLQSSSIIPTHDISLKRLRSSDDGIEELCSSPLDNVYSTGKSCLF